MNSTWFGRLPEPQRKFSVDLANQQTDASRNANLNDQKQSIDLLAEYIELTTDTCSVIRCSIMAVYLLAKQNVRVRFSSSGLFGRIHKESGHSSLEKNVWIQCKSP